ncbi:ABC transporter permease [Neobacillus mesonae]|uniref:ABC transporter permease n=1 Tax=Neobacillus mesonae TaxID=1193713 RepID=UPI0025736024|nr:ABC transporter permease [Neobacillus mesonae]
MSRTEYFRRWKKENGFQLKVFGMVVDWTVFTYLVIPVIIALVVIDYKLWQSPPGWTSYIPFELFGLSLFLIAQFFTIRTYIERADELFVIQNGRYYQTLLQFGKYFTLLKSALITGGILLYLWPVFTYGYHFSNIQVLAIFIYVFLWSLFQKLAERWFFLRRIIWRRRIFSFAVFVLYAIGIYAFLYNQIIFWSLGLLVMTAVRLLLKKDQRPLRTFHAEAERERREKWKWASFLMAQSGEYDGIKKTRKSSLFNKHSRPLFLERTPEKVLAEMYWKWLIRKGRNLKFYLYYIFVAFYAETLLPEKIKLIVLAFIIFAGYKIQGGMWKSFINHPFTKNMGHLSDARVRSGRRRALGVTWLLPCGLVTLWAVFFIFAK